MTTYSPPAEHIAAIKTGLVALGYAQEDTPNEFVQDCYFKYIMIRQTGFNPNIPYALSLLPSAIQIAIGGGADPEDPEEPVEPDGSIRMEFPHTAEYLDLLDQIRTGAWAPNTPYIPNSRNVISPEHATITTWTSGLTVDDLDPAIIKDTQSNGYVINYTIPLIVEIKNMDQETYDGMIAGTSSPPLIYYLDVANNEWIDVQLDPTMLLFKHPVTGKFYVIAATEAVVASPESAMILVAFDLSAVDLTARFGSMLNA